MIRREEGNTADISGVFKEMSSVRISKGWMEYLLPEEGEYSGDVLFKLVYLPWEEKEEPVQLSLPLRLINPEYGSSELEANLKKLAENAPPIEKVWEITKKLPSFTHLILEERENE